MRKKVIHIITGLGTGGAEAVLERLVVGMQDSVDSIVVSLTSGGVVRQALERAGVRVVTLRGLFKYDPILLVKLVLFLRKEKPDILHTHLFHATLAGRIAGTLARVPNIISTFHGSFAQYPFRAFCMRAINHLSDVNVIVSKSLVSEVPNATVIHNGIDCEFVYKNLSKKEIRMHLGLPQEQFVFVSVGRLVKEKGYRELIRLWKDISANPILVIVGDGPDYCILKDEITDFGLEDRVFLAGYSDKVEEYLAAGDAFVVSSVSEGFSLVAFEAGCARLPVVSTDVGAVSEIVERDFLASTICELQAPIERMIGLSEDERDSIGYVLEQKIRTSFSIEKMIQNYRTLYEIF